MTIPAKPRPGRRSKPAAAPPADRPHTLPTQRRVLMAAYQHVREYGLWPTRAYLAGKLNMTRAGLDSTLKALRRRGLVGWDDNCSRAVRVVGCEIQVLFCGDGARKLLGELFPRMGGAGKRIGEREAS